MQPSELTDHIEVAADPALVWDLIGDPREMPRWSPQVVSVRLREGFDAIEVGTQFTNRNEQGEVAWTTHGEVVRLDPGRELAFRIRENGVVWSYAVEPTPGGCRLTERRETPDGIAPQAAQWAAENLGGLDAFSASMTTGVRQTLEAVKAAAEA